MVGRKKPSVISLCVFLMRLQEMPFRIGLPRQAPLVLEVLIQISNCPLAARSSPDPRRIGSASSNT